MKSKAFANLAAAAMVALAVIGGGCKRQEDNAQASSPASTNVTLTEPLIRRARSVSTMIKPPRS
jgi:hypothetical protein